MPNVVKKEQYQICVNNFHEPASTREGVDCRQDRTLRISVRGGEIEAQSCPGNLLRLESNMTVKQARLMIEALQMFVDNEAPNVDVPF